VVYTAGDQIRNGKIMLLVVWRRIENYCHTFKIITVMSATTSDNVCSLHEQTRSHMLSLTVCYYWNQFLEIRFAKFAARRMSKTRSHWFWVFADIRCDISNPWSVASEQIAVRCTGCSVSDTSTASFISEANWWLKAYT